MSLFCSLMFNVIGIPSLHNHVLSSVQKPILVYSHYKYKIKTVKVERQEWTGGGVEIENKGTSPPQHSVKARAF